MKTIEKKMNRKRFIKNYNDVLKYIALVYNMQLKFLFIKLITGKYHALITKIDNNINKPTNSM